MTVTAQGFLYVNKRSLIAPANVLNYALPHSYQRFPMLIAINISAEILYCFHLSPSLSLFLSPSLLSSPLSINLPPSLTPCYPVSYSLTLVSGAGKISSPNVGHRKGSEGIAASISSSINGISSSSGMDCLYPIITHLKYHFLLSLSIFCSLYVTLSLSHFIYTYTYVCTTLSLVHSVQAIEIMPQKWAHTHTLHY